MAANAATEDDAVPAEPTPDGADGEIALAEIPSVPEEASEEAASGNGDAGQPRRRRRRGRRGRGRGGAAAGIPRGNDAAAPAFTASLPAAAEDEPFVPRGVVAHELMPAATGGRRRRGHRGGRPRNAGLGGEPVDPQLISPSNPVPKPRFDED